MSEGAAITPPPLLGRRFVRYVIGYGVWIAVGLGPFLGKIQVPGFSPLLELFPVTMQQELIPICFFLFSTVAVAVQFQSAGVTSRATLKRRFRFALTTVLVLLLALFVLYKLFVIDVGVDRRVLVVRGLTRSGHCQCDPSWDDARCVRWLGINDNSIRMCWDHLTPIELGLEVPYTILMGGFGWLVGLLLLRERKPRPRK